MSDESLIPGSKRNPIALSTSSESESASSESETKTVASRTISESETKTVASPTSSESETKTVSGSHQFVIQGYSLTKGMGVGKYIESDIFSAGGYEWVIKFYPDGKGFKSFCAEYSSVYIALTSKCSHLNTTVFEIALVDQSGKGNHKFSSIVHAPFNSVPGDPLRYQEKLWYDFHPFSPNWFYNST